MQAMVRASATADRPGSDWPRQDASGASRGSFRGGADSAVGGPLGAARGPAGPDCGGGEGWDPPPSSPPSRSPTSAAAAGGETATSAQPIAIPRAIVRSCSAIPCTPLGPPFRASDEATGARAGARRSGLRLVVLRADLGVLRPLLGELVLREAGVHGARLDAGVAVDALVRIDVELLDVVVVGLVRRRMDAVDGADLYAGVVLLADAGLRDDVCQGAYSFPEVVVASAAPIGRRGTQHFR